MNDGVLDEVPLDRVGAFRSALAPWLAENFPEIAALNNNAPELSNDLRTRLKTSLIALARSVMAGEQKHPAGQP